jgi:hypothetical protein
MAPGLRHTIFELGSSVRRPERGGLLTVVRLSATLDFPSKSCSFKQFADRATWLVLAREGCPLRATGTRDRPPSIVTMKLPTRGPSD